MEGNQLFTCQTCLKTYKLKTSLRRHQKIHSDSKAAVCNVCKRRCTGKSDLKRHMEMHTQERFPCPKCTTTFNTSASRTRHIRYIHEKPDAFPCDRCDYKFSLQSRLTKHYKIHTTKEIDYPFQCNICEKRFLFNRYLKLHLQTMHIKKTQISCSICDKVYSTNGKLKEHIKYDHAEAHQEIRCPECHKTFSRPHSLKKHLVMHSSDSHPWKCNLCNKEYTQKVHLTAHKLEHSGKRPFFCSLNKCGKCFSSEIKLKRHIRLCHSGLKYGCWICHREFSRNYILTAHLKLYPGSHFSCHLCKRIYTNKARFDIHMEMHKKSVRKGYTCNICDKSVSSQKALKIHLARDHKCTKNNRDNILQSTSGQCKTYPKKQGLKCRRNLHTAVRLFKCLSCDHTFLRKESLFIHKKKYFQCRTVISKAVTKKKRKGNPIRNNMRGNYVTGHMTGSDVTGHMTGSDVTGHMTGGDVTGHMTGSDVTGHLTGSDVTGHLTGSDVTGHMTGSDVTGHTTGSDVTGQMTGSDVTGHMTGNCVTGHLTGSDVTGHMTGSDVTGHMALECKVKLPYLNTMFDSKTILKEEFDFHKDNINELDHYIYKHELKTEFKEELLSPSQMDDTLIKVFTSDNTKDSNNYKNTPDSSPHSSDYSVEIIARFPPSQSNTVDKIQSLEETDSKAASMEIKCSVCAETYNNMMDYTHHLNVHLQSLK